MKDKTDFMSIAREKIDCYDADILDLIAKRIKVCEEIGAFKRENNIPMMQSGRVNEVIEKCKKIGVNLKLDSNFVERIFQIIISETCRIEDEIIGK